MRKTIGSLALCAVLAVVPGSAAQAAGYKGKTKGGSSITFKLKGSKISAVNTVVPALCVETTGSGMTRAGAELFQPQGKFRLGGTSKGKSLDPAALNGGTKATKNYTVSSRRSGGRVTGKLKLSYSFLRLDLFRRMPYTYICSGSTSFSATRR